MEPINHKELRMRGLEVVKSNWKLSICAAFIAMLLSGVGSSFLPELDFSWTQELDKDFIWHMTDRSRITFSLNFDSLMNLCWFIIGGTIQLGYCNFLLKRQRGEETQVGDLFTEFNRFGDGFAQHFLCQLYIFLWSLLLIIPGIIKSFSYAMTPYIMAENPGMKATDAITRSRAMMDGYKADLFMLRLTFIGWDLLAVLTLNIGHLWLNPYKQAAETAFYQEVKAQFVAQI